MEPQILQNDYEISADSSRLQLRTIHELLLSQYWSRGIPIATVAQAIQASLCFGVYQHHEQVGFARVVTDSATFAWVCDVVIAPSHRDLGLSKKLMQTILEHPQLQNLRRICLATKDAHGLYEQFGFKVTETPQNWMEIKNNAVYA